MRKSWFTSRAETPSAKPVRRAKPYKSRVDPRLRKTNARGQLRPLNERRSAHERERRIQKAWRRQFEPGVRQSRREPLISIKDIIAFCGGLG